MGVTLFRLDSGERVTSVFPVVEDDTEDTGDTSDTGDTGDTGDSMRPDTNEGGAEEGDDTNG